MNDNLITTTQQKIKTLFQESDLQELPPWKASVVRGARVVYRIIRDFADGQLSLQAMSLVYTTLITLVPLLALCFSVLKGFGVHNQIEPFLLNLFAPMGDQGAEIADKIIGFVDNIKVGVLGALGLALLLYSVIALMHKIERAFNFIWRVQRSRRFAQRFSDYLSVLLFGPLLIFLSAGITGSLRSFDVFERFGLSGAWEILLSVAGVILPYVLMTLAFTFIYIFMPNTKVKIVPAMIGGLFAAMMWKIMGYVFSSLIAGSASYVAIYAAFATLILFMIWTYLAWLVVLIGANIAFYVQHPRFARVGRTAHQLSSRIKEDIALAILVEIGRKFYNWEKGCTPEELNQSLRVPITIIHETLDCLQDQGMIVKADDKMQDYVPAIPYDQTSLSEVLSLVRSHGESAWPHQPKKLPETVRNFRKEFESQFNKTVGKKKLRDLL